MLVDATIDSRVITPLSICWIKMRRRVTSGMRLVENTRAEEPPQLFIHAKTHAKHPNRDSCDVKAKSIRASFSTQFHITTSCCSYGSYATPSVSHMLLYAPNSSSTYICTTLPMPPYIIFKICNTSPTSNYSRSSSRTPNTCSIRSGG